jgi:hypothetical protein
MAIEVNRRYQSRNVQPRWQRRFTKPPSSQQGKQERIWPELLRIERYVRRNAGFLKMIAALHRTSESPLTGHRHIDRSLG